MDDRVVLLRLALPAGPVRDLLRRLLVVPMQPALPPSVRRVASLAVVRLLLEGRGLFQWGRAILLALVTAPAFLPTDTIRLDTPPP